MDEITRLFTVAIDGRCFIFFDLIQKYRDDSCFTLGILPWSVDIGIAEYSRFDSIVSFVKSEEEFYRAFGDTIGSLWESFVRLGIRWCTYGKHSSSCRGKYHTFTADALHGLDDIHGATNIDIYIVSRVFHSFTDIDLCREMKYDFWAEIGENLVHPPCIADIPFTEAETDIIPVLL